MRVWSLIFVGLALSCALASARGPKRLTRGPSDIVMFLAEYLTKDVTNNREGIAKSSEQIAKLANTIIAYVDKTNSATLKVMQAANEKNMKMMMDQVVQNDNSLQTQTSTNNEKLSSALIKTTNNALDEMKSRMKQHEDLLSTHVALCAFAPSHSSMGPVLFDQILLDSITIKGKPTGSNALQDGSFYVPEGGDGTYQVTFGMILDTIGDISFQTAPVAFALKSNIDKNTSTHHDSMVTSDAGYRDHDLVPASRTIHLDMKFGDSIWLEQFFPTAETSYKLNMCVHLVHPRPPGYNNWQSIKPVVAPTLEPNHIFEAPTLELFTVDNQSIDVRKPEVKITAPEVMIWSNAPLFKGWAPKATITNMPSNPRIAQQPLYGQDLYGHDGIVGWLEPELELESELEGSGSD